MFRVLKRKFANRRKSNFSVSVDSFQGQLSDLDSSSLGNSSEEEDQDLDGPTLITVDDGKGGIKHVRVPRPLESHADTFSYGSSSCHEGGEKAPEGKLETSLSIGELVRREFKGKHLLHVDVDAERLHKRIVSKKGVVNIGRSHMERKQRSKYIVDFFNTMLDMKWRYVLLIFTASFFMSWLAFATIWYLILLAHGDFQPEHLPDKQSETGWMPCVYAMHNFSSCFLFSIETQHTIGYGSRQTSEKCPEAIFVMSFQSVVGVMIQACMVGTIFAKLSRPKRRAQTLLFSKNAVVCRRDGHLCLCFRVANMRSSHLVECHTRAILVSKKVTEEGEHIPYHQTELNVGTDFEGKEQTIFFIWPMTIVHRIDEDSPFYTMSARDILKKRYELIVMLEGIVEPTGMSIQARTSYLPNEILWGHRFVNVLNYRRKDEEYKIDYGSFNTLYKVDTPVCSAKMQFAILNKGRDLSRCSYSDENGEYSSISKSRKPSRNSQISKTPTSPLPMDKLASVTSEVTNASLPILPQIRVFQENVNSLGEASGLTPCDKANSNKNLVRSCSSNGGSQVFLHKTSVSSAPSEMGISPN